VVRVATIAFALSLVAAAPASARLEGAATHHYRVTAGSMQLETREETGFERLTWSVAPHARGTRPAPGSPTADGSGGVRSFDLRFPVRGTYTYEHEEDSGTCKETLALAEGSRGTVAARPVGSRVRISWRLDPRRRVGHVAPACRPQTNNALVYFRANQPSLAVNVAADNLGKTRFTVTARGTHTHSDGTLTWRVTLSVLRLGSR
jgi:hypothetical protein